MPQIAHGEGAYLQNMAYDIAIKTLLLVSRHTYPQTRKLTLYYISLTYYASFGALIIAFAKKYIDHQLFKAPEGLGNTGFMPERGRDNTIVLVGINGDFAVPGHGSAFKIFSVLPDFHNEDCRNINCLFVHLRVTHWCLSF